MLAALVVLQGCSSVRHGAIPVVDAGAPVSENGIARNTSSGGYVPPAAAVQAQVPQPVEQGGGVTVMVPQGNSAPLTFAAPEASSVGGASSASGISTGGWVAPAPSVSAQAPVQPTGIPSASGSLSADERLDGPVLALLTTAQQLQNNGDFNGAASSLERAQRIAPREPQVLYRLAQVRLERGDAVQSEQLARRALSYAGDRPALQASLWELIAQSRQRQGDAAGAAQARERAKVTL
ncbi:tetratricopeptide repeat protein [Pseudomonas sp. ABC1]|nr:tetratricopeptide repeat protein [Pseudomonas sp. ABC1]